MTSIVLTRGSRSPAGSTFGSLPRVSVRRAQHRRRTEGKLSLVVSGLVVLAVVAVLGWDLFGGRLFVMETPSMCPAVCVGSLVADGPVRGPLHVGELITFHPPGTKTETYTHEISHIFPNGMIQTRGVANPDHDPWLITRSDIVGIVDLNVWGLGWLLRVLPFLAVGVLAWVLARPRLARRTRSAWDTGWVTVLAVLPLWVLHPLVSGAILSTASGPKQRSCASVINTGILPVSFNGAGCRPVSHVMPSLLVRLGGSAPKGGYVILHEAASLYWWGWVIVALVVLSPLAGYLWHIRRDEEVLAD